MKGIMRKRLVALLSAAGLAGTAASYAAQGDKGSNPAPDTKNESQVKLEKAKKENSAKKGGKKVSPEYTRYKKGQAEAGAASNEADVKGGRSAHSLDAGSKDAAKVSKASHEKSATTDVVNEKRHKTQAHTDALTVKQKTGVHPDVRKQGGDQFKPDQGQPGQPSPKSTPETPK